MTLTDCSSFKLTTLLNEWTKEELLSVCLLGNTKRLKEAIRRKRPGLLTKGLGVILHDNARQACLLNKVIV
jgi:hypothetical protein